MISPVTSGRGGAGKLCVYSRSGLTTKTNIHVNSEPRKYKYGKWLLSHANPRIWIQQTYSKEHFISHLFIDGKTLQNHYHVSLSLSQTKQHNIENQKKMLR